MTRKIQRAIRRRGFRFSFGLILILQAIVPLAMPRPSQEQAEVDPPPNANANPPLRRERILSSEDAHKWGEITVAQPKIWQYERVNAMLDGLLRDVEGVSMADLTRLDPSSQNAGAIKFIQDALGVAVQYNQAAQVNTRNTLQTWQVQHDQQVEQLKQYNDYVTSLNSQRAQIASQLFAANNTVATIQGQASGGQLTPEQQTQLTNAQNRATTLKTQLNDVNSMITAAGPAPTLATPPTVQGTSAELLAQPPLASFTDLMNSLPDGVKKGLNSALQSPSYPASKQLDNFITLLHERLAREISVQQDDLMRDPNTLAFLVQFDVGLYPSSKAKNHLARVEFELAKCPGCKVYSLYPAQSSYNIANYQGASHRRSFTGNLLTLIGLGITSSYQRQENTLQGSLVQSVYISGFQDDTNSGDVTSRGVAQRFGWYYSAAPFDQYVTPGIRSTFALITVPRKLVECFQEKQEKESVRTDPICAALEEEDDPRPQLMTRPEQYQISLTAKADWAKRDDPLYQKSGWFSKKYLGKEHQSEVERSLHVELPGTVDLNNLPSTLLSDQRRIHVLRMEYNPVASKKVATAPTSAPSPKPTLAPSPAAAASASEVSSAPNLCTKHDCATVLVSLDMPIDPNLVVTVHGNLLQRVRDWRGRSTSVLPPAQSESDLSPPSAGGLQIKTQKPASRSLMEVDQLQPDSWFAVTSHDLLLSISRSVAGEEEFPIIQLSVPGKQTLVIPNDLHENMTEVIEDGFRFIPPDQLKNHIGRILGIDHDGAQMRKRNQAERKRSSGLGGPFPPATFMPLFQQDLAAKKFYAMVGQTGKDLIVGFLSSGTEASRQRYSFLETRALAILEDPDLDLAWPLPCEARTEDLICHLPIETIRQGYREVAEMCPKEDSCPSIEQRIAHLPSNPKQGSLSEEKPRPGFVSGLQVWIKQYDPEGENAFWSPEPAKISLFPLSDTFTPEPGDSKEPNNARRPQTAQATSQSRESSQDSVFMPWHFDGAHTTADRIAIEECKYFGDVPNADLREKIRVRYLTPPDFVDPAGAFSNPYLTRSTQEGCGFVTLATSTLQTPEIVLQLRILDENALREIQDKTAYKRNMSTWTATIPTPQLRPEFKEPIVRRTLRTLGGPSDSVGITGWDVSIPVNRMYCTDDIEERSELEDAGVQVQWPGRPTETLPSSAHPASPLAKCPDEWWVKQQAGQIRLHVVISKSAVSDLPETLHLVRTTSNGVRVRVAELRNFRNLVLPSKLTLQPLGDNQFALRGYNAGAIDAVALQYDGKAITYSAAGAGDLAVVDTISPTSSKTPRGTVRGPKKGQSQKYGAQAQATTSPASTCCRRVGDAAPASPSPSPAANAQAAAPPAVVAPGRNAAPAVTSKPRQTTPDAKAALSPGTYAVLPLIRDGAKYIPLAVTDDGGAPLVFTKKKPTEPDTGKTPAKPEETITITKTTAK